MQKYSLMGNWTFADNKSINKSQVQSKNVQIKQKRRLMFSSQCILLIMKNTAYM